MEKVKLFFIKHTKYKYEDILSICVIHDGYTNINYKIKLKDGKKYQIKISKGTNADYFNEVNALKLYNDTSYIYFNNKGYRIKEWIEGEVINEWDDETIIGMAKKIKLMHAISPVNLISHNYKQYLFVDLNIKFLNTYLLLVKKYENETKVFSHNDLNKNNVIKNSNTLTFIDFEYARANSPYWDIANLINESNFTNWQIKILIHTYKNVDENKLNDYLYIHLFYSYAWSLSHPEKELILNYKTNLKSRLLDFDFNKLNI